MSSYLMSEQLMNMEKLVLANNGGCQDITGDDTDTGGYRLIIPDADDCGTIVRAIAPGENINIALDETNNILRINASEGGSTVGGGGGIVSFNVVSSRLFWDGVIRIYTQSQSFIDVVIPPNQTSINYTYRKRSNHFEYCVCGWYSHEQVAVPILYNR